MARILGIMIAIILFAFALLFVIAAAKENTGPRIIVAVVLIGMGAGVTWLVVLKKPEVVSRVEVTQKIDLSGDVKIDLLKCESCGASLDSKSVLVREGATFVKCGACGNEYQIVEKPKW